MHLLALRISEFLGPKPDAVLKHWACAKIVKSRQSIGDEEICRVIFENFEELGGRQLCGDSEEGTGSWSNRIGDEGQVETWCLYESQVLI